MALPWVLVLCAILIAMGVMGSFQVSSARTVLERIHARRLIDLAASSAFAEACGRLEQNLPTVPKATFRQDRDLKSTVRWPEEGIAPKTAADEMEKLGITYTSPVTFESSPWRIKFNRIRGIQTCQEQGLLDMTVQVKVQVGATTMEKKITVRRYVTAYPNRREQQCHIRVFPVNLLMEVAER